ncbi:MAG: DUF1801 domain-containing protein [Planctomycetaceae bacterium]|nr:DUF1801 domain-containing protein [Planctomycetaceae bacterium]
MQSKATTVDQYLKEIPADRRNDINAVRGVLKANLPEGYEEIMQYGMIGYVVPHRLFPQGYHCDPRQPLCFAGLASQKNHLSLYLMPLYGESPELTWFETEWKKSGKKLDMGKCCIRFKKADDIPIDLIGKLVARWPVSRWTEIYQSMLDTRTKGKPAAGKPAASKTATVKAEAALKKTAKSPAGSKKSVTPATKKTAKKSTSIASPAGRKTTSSLKKSPKKTAAKKRSVK